MAQEKGALSSAQKGKGKAEESKPTDGKKKAEEPKKDKDGKPIVNGLKGDEPEEGRQENRSLYHKEVAEIGTEELSEEDQTLKNELEMLVSRLKV